MLHTESVGRGPPLVLLHGWALHGGLFSPLVAQLINDFTLYCVDLPGHGHSPLCTPFTLEKIVEEVCKATTEIDGPLTVLGWSFGGMVAQAWALAQPERIARLVLCCTKPKFVKAPDWEHGTSPEVLQSLVDGFTSAPAETMERFLSLNVSAGESLAQARRLARARPHVRAEAMREGLNVLTQFDIRAQLQAIAQPALVITGGLDRLTHPSVGAFYEAALPNSQLLHIARAAHAPHLSHTQDVALALRKFAHE